MCQRCNQPATMGCLCVTPPFSLCGDCVAGHLEKKLPPPLIHQMKLLDQIFPSLASISPAQIALPELEHIRRDGLPLVPPVPMQIPKPAQSLPTHAQAPKPAPIRPVPKQAENPPKLPTNPQNSAMPVQVSIPSQNPPANSPASIASFGPGDAPKIPPKESGPRPAPLQLEETKEIKPPPKRQPRRPNEAIRSQPESPKGLQRLPNSQLFPDKSQPPSPKKLKDPCACQKAESTVVIINGDKPQKACDTCAENYTDVLPLSTFSLLTTSDIIDFAIEKFNYAKTMKERLEENLNRIDRFKVKAEKEFDNTIKELQKCKIRMLSKVAEIRRDIESKLTVGLSDIEANLCNRNYKPQNSNEYAFIMWEKRVEDLNYDLFVSRCSVPDIVGAVTRTIDYEVKGLFSLNCIPIIRDTEIVKFNCKREIWCPRIPLIGEITVSKHTVFTYIGGQEVVCTGNYNAKTLQAFASAYIVNMATGIANAILDMETARYHHGSIWIGRNVYVFGGKGPDYLSACEKLCLDHQDRPWSQLSDMGLPRARFNPFVKGELIYLMGGSNTRDCELYDFIRDTFLPLSFFIPLAKETTAVVLGSNVYVFQDKKGVKWDISRKSTKSEDIYRGLEEPNDDINLVWSNFTPLVIAGRLYIASNRSKEIIRQALGSPYDVTSFPIPRVLSVDK